MEDYERIAKLEFALRAIIGLAQSASRPDSSKLDKAVALSDIRTEAENVLLNTPASSSSDPDQATRC